MSLNEKLSNIGYSISGFLVLMGHQETCTGKHTAVGRVVTVVQVLAFTVILCPLGVVYVFGLGISTGISLWRLIQHDYVDTDSDPSKVNLRPALDVLYSVALLQGAIFSYTAIFSTKGKILANAMLESYDVDDRARLSVLEYVHETRVGCEKDPSFATRGRNLVTYALDLMESNSPDSYLTGVRIMDTLVRDRRSWPGDPPAAAPAAGSSPPELAEPALAATQQLLESPSASHVLRKLMRTLDTVSPYGDEARERAASIVDHLALHIHLEQFPEGMQWIPSLLHQQAFPSQSQHQHQQSSQLELILHGLQILHKLARKDSNLRALRDTPGLLSKITAPVSCHRHDHDHGEWWLKASMASLNLVDRLVVMDGGPGPAGAGDKLRQEDSQQAIISIENVLRCHNCPGYLQEKAMYTLEYLSLPGDAATRIAMPMPSRDDGNRSPRKFVDILIDCLGQDNQSPIREWAGKMLEMLSSDSASSGTLVLDAKGDIVAALTKVIVDGMDSEYMLRIRAAQTLGRLCGHCYTMGDEYRNKLKEAMIPAVPKVKLAPFLFPFTTPRHRIMHRRMYVNR